MCCLAPSLHGRIASFVLLSLHFASFSNGDAVSESHAALQAGLDIESQRNWGEGVRHYEQAIKKWPQDAALELRLKICRVHADVQRRYQDKSYVEGTRTASTEQALDLYLEVLSNIETYYVDSPHWDQLQKHGTAFLEVALTEPLFLRQHLSHVDPAKVENFRLHVHEQLAGRPTRTRFDLRVNASYVAGLARQHLGLPGQVTVLEYVCGAVGLLDPYTRYLTRQQLEETLSNIDGNFVGLGVELKCEPDGLRIVSVIPAGPAALSGIRKGELIVAVNDARIGEYSAETIADLLRGPEGTYLSTKVVNPEGASRLVTVQRRRVDVPSVENVHIADTEHGVGYLKLTAFQKTTMSDVDQALANLYSRGLKTLIIDVRGNPGGLLQASVDVADRFLNEGKIVSTMGRNSKENFEYVAHRAGTWNLPIVVLIDRDSASASEIFAGAIRDNQRGYVLGENSYGKGSVQGIFRMESFTAGLCLTTAKFYSPSGKEINRNGVAPNEEIPTRDAGPSNSVTLLRPQLDVAASGSDINVDPASMRDQVYLRAIEIGRQEALRLSRR
jgi:carboxyl-terminal processing protease